jgi:RNA polymerase sigma factor (sigma-70 family)
MDVLAQRFEDSRPHLAAVAYRMLGSRAEADDAVQEAWLRLARSDVDGVDNLRGWLTTVVARVCLDMLRSRTSRREEPLTTDERVAPEPGPEGEAVLADSVGAALVVVLDTLAPAERLAFVLHDLFAVPFDEIGAIVGRSPAAARQLASRARRRVQGASPDDASEAADEPTNAGQAAGRQAAAVGQADATREAAAGGPGRRAGAAAVGQADATHKTAEDRRGQVDLAGLARRQEVVVAFLAASRSGDFAALLALLDPDAVALADAAAVAAGAEAEVRGADAVAGTFAGRARAARVALLDGEPGLVWTHRSEVRMAFAFTVLDGRVTGIELVADPARLAAMGVEPAP